MLALCHFSLLLQQRPRDIETVEFGAHGHGDQEVCELGAGAWGPYAVSTHVGYRTSRRILKIPNKRLALLFEDQLKLKLSLSTNCYGRTN